jgi:hypothetical protein
MKLFDFGKRKDDVVEEYFVDEDSDNGQDKDSIKEDEENITEEDEENITEEDMNNNNHENFDEIDENVSDYIDPDDLDYEEYGDIVTTIEEYGWHRVSGVACPITTLDKQIAFQKTAKANCCDIILEVVCPPKRIIAICGDNECDVDSLKDIQIPHFCVLICTDVNGAALAQTALISILKYTKDEEVETLYQEFYGDLSPIIDGKLKRKGERYHFANTIILQGGEKLIFKLNNSDTDISKIEFLMLSDIFEQDEEE